MSTTASPRPDPIDSRRHPYPLPSALRTDSTPFRPEQLRQRLAALDELDARFGGFESDALSNRGNSSMRSLAKALQARLEAANAELCRSVRSEVVRGATPHALLQWVQDSADSNRSGNPWLGFGFDWRDEFVAGILQLREPDEPAFQRSTEMAPYQPTPVRHILQLIAASAVSEHDLFVDIGAGLGHVPLLVSLFTGVRCLGVEVEPAYVASARRCAQDLRLSRVGFVAEDARATDLSSGTVFYLYSPFTGSILCDVLNRLRLEATRRSIKVCSLGPCTAVVASELWLKASALPQMGRIAVFESQ